MRISSINSNVKFGQIERTTAERLLEKADTPQSKFSMKQTIISADKAKDYLVWYNFDTKNYDVYPPKGIDNKPATFKYITDAVSYSLDEQKKYDDKKFQSANEYSDEEILNLFTWA